MGLTVASEVKEVYAAWKYVLNVICIQLTYATRPVVLFLCYSCLARSLGEAGEIEPTTTGILMEYDIDFEEFNEEVIYIRYKIQ